MLEIDKTDLNQITTVISDLKNKFAEIKEMLNYSEKKQELLDLNKKLDDPEIWKDQPKAEKYGKQKSRLDNLINNIEQLSFDLDNSCELLNLIKEDREEKKETNFAENIESSELIDDLINDINNINSLIEKLEFERMFNGKLDSCSSFIDFKSGSGGTESQDWANMLLRMFTMWADRHKFKVEVLELSPGEVAGIKNATLKITGDYAYGWLRTETGIHRLVRKSPFNANGKRHTSFASIFIYPEINDEIEININPADLRIDTYRASGAGGQHVNTTDSAIRVTHIPTGITVQCQNERSQHKNKAQAMSQLKAKMYELEKQKQDEEKQNLEDSKSDIGWGHQIRSYVLDQSRIKDLRTGVEVVGGIAVDRVLAGDLDKFIEASLKSSVQ